MAGVEQDFTITAPCEKGDLTTFGSKHVESMKESLVLSALVACDMPVLINHRVTGLVNMVTKCIRMHTPATKPMMYESVSQCRRTLIGCIKLDGSTTLSPHNPST